MHEVFAEFALLLLMSAAAGAVSLWLRQPVLIAYIVIGIVAGPAVLGVVTAHDQIDLLAQVGVAVLLFVVGLKLDLQHIRHIGPVALATGLGQLAFTIVIGFLIILAMGKGWVEALYVAVALTFSSTIIIVKLLSDKREIDSLHGRIAIGFLIVQDLAVVVAMMVMSALRGDGGEGSLLALAGSLALRLGVAAVGMYLLMRYVLPRVVDRMAQSQELLLIFAIAWGTGLAALGEWAGFSKEAGAFLAGFSLASTHYRDAINARLTGIRDFLLLFFFIDLGAKLDFSTLGGEVWPAVVLSLFVLIGNPLIVMAIMGYMGYRKRTGFLCGLTVAQISEFSIIFVAMGISLGHVDKGALGLTTLVGLITIALSTYMILYSHPLYEKLASWLGVFERQRPYRELAVATARHDLHEADVIVFGLGRYGSRLALGLQEVELKVLGVEFDPEVVSALRQQGLPVRYGDGIASEFLESLPLKDTRWVVSTLPDMASNRDLLRGLRELHFTGEVAIVAREDFDGAVLKRMGAPTILYPMRNAVDFAVETLASIIRYDGAAK
ncbi:MAG TPA: cation:proton antiporter [Candidatus Accumulibacter phosphatis]|nr:sodium:proton exchanger [Accumulibacter sp.]HRL75358.1 cation:proton antiporter [Candidatus Accumulibacter phosphatis]HRQ95933.1 cation:proton antiporter [Candidatus Accumulibacter phosphatis]